MYSQHPGWRYYRTIHSAKRAANSFTGSALRLMMASARHFNAVFALGCPPDPVTITASTTKSLAHSCFISLQDLF